MKFHILPINGFRIGIEIDKTTAISDYKYIVDIGLIFWVLWIEIRRKK